MTFDAEQVCKGIFTRASDVIVLYALTSFAKLGFELSTFMK